MKKVYLRELKSDIKFFRSIMFFTANYLCFHHFDNVNKKVCPYA